MGNHSYKAVFAETNAYVSSSSSVSTLVVTGTTGAHASTTTIAETVSWGNYALTATVTESGAHFLSKPPNHPPWNPGDEEHPCTLPQIPRCRSAEYVCPQPS
jgi:hypothetical protein